MFNKHVLCIYINCLNKFSFFNIKNENAALSNYLSIKKPPCFYKVVLGFY